MEENSLLPHETVGSAPSLLIQQAFNNRAITLFLAIFREIREVSALLFKCIGVRFGLGSETKNSLAIERFG